MQLMLQLRRCAVFIINWCFNHDEFLRVIGWLNKRLNLIHSVFLGYTVNDHYLGAYTWPKYSKQTRWRPWIVGIYRQAGRWGLLLGVSATDSELRDQANRSRMNLLVKDTIKIQRLVAAKELTYAGVLTGILYMLRLIPDTTVTWNTVKAIMRAEAQLRDLYGYAGDTPLIVIGGGGFVGRRVRSFSNGRSVYCVDLANNGPSKRQWPKELYGKPAVAINVASTEALMQHSLQFWPGLIVLNDAYPEPSPEIINAVTAPGATLYHLVGMRGWAFPSFPAGYRGAVPCCAATEISKQDVIVRKLLPDSIPNKRKRLI